MKDDRSISMSLSLGAIGVLRFDDEDWQAYRVNEEVPFGQRLKGRGRFELEAIQDLYRLEAAPLHVREASPDPWKFHFAWLPTRLDDGSWTWLAGYERRYVSAPSWFSHNCLGWVERQRLPSRKV